jgi:hypothetical protein
MPWHQKRVLERARVQRQSVLRDRKSRIRRERQFRSVPSVRSIARPAHLLSLKRAARKQAPWRCAAAWSQRRPSRRLPVNPPPSVPMSTPALPAARHETPRHWLSPRLHRGRYPLGAIASARAKSKPLSFRPIQKRQSWSCPMPISGNASPAPRPTAKPYRVGRRRAVPIRCCRGPSNRGTRPKLPDFVRR